MEIISVFQKILVKITKISQTSALSKGFGHEVKTIVLGGGRE